MAAAAGTMPYGSRKVEIIQLFNLVLAPELSWLRLPAALAKRFSIKFEVAKATGTNGTGIMWKALRIVLST